MGKVMDEIAFLKNFRARFTNDSAFVSAVKEMYQANMISAKAWEIIRDDYSSAPQVRKTKVEKSPSHPLPPPKRLVREDVLIRPSQKVVQDKKDKDTDPCSHGVGSGRTSPCS